MSPGADPLPAIAILAAGGSRRLGRPKQLLTRQGVSLVRRVARMAVQLPAARRLVVIGGAAVDVQAELAGLPLEPLQNPEWEEGMASSIRVVVRALDGHHGACLFIAIDQPALELEHLQALLDLSRRRPGHDVATAYAALSGVPALLQPATWRQGLQLHGDTGLRRLLRRPAQDVLTIQAPALALDVDTPDSLAQAVRQGWLDAPTDT